MSENSNEIAVKQIQEEMYNLAVQKNKIDDRFKQLKEELQEICTHPEDKVIETVRTFEQGEYHFYPITTIIYERHCKQCWLNEKIIRELVSDGNEVQEFQKIKTQGKQVVL